jgi:hypothetical protein
MNAAETAKRPAHAAERDTTAEVLGDLLSTEASAPIEGEPPRRSVGRAGLVLVLVLLIQIGFLAAYVGALHSPTPDSLPVAVVSSDSAVSEISGALAKADRDGVGAKTYPNPDAALDAVHQRKAYAALIPAGAGGTELRIASAGGTDATDSLVRAYGKAADSVGIQMAVFDNHPVGPKDSGGRSAFFLVIAWVIGGYLAAAALAIAAGSIPATVRRAHLRVLALLAYSALSGIAGAVIAGPVLEIWPGNTVVLAAFAFMLVFGSAMTAAALQGWLGLLGTAGAITLLVMLGSPGAGGLVSPELLPGFFQSMQSWVLPGVGTHLVRSLVYFGGNAIQSDLIALWIYGLGGAVAFLLASTIKPGKYRTRLTGS